MKIHLRIFTLCIFMSIFALSARSQLVAGDIAFTGYNAETTPATGGPYDSFSFVILRTGGLPAGTVINFTDCGWINTSACGTDQFFAENGISESTITWTSPGSVLAYGTQVTISGPNASSGTVTNAGTTNPSGTGLTLTIAGDQIIAFQGSRAANTIIAGIHANVVAGTTTDAGWDNPAGSTSTSFIPPCLTNGVNAVIVYSGASIASAVETDNCRLSCLTITGNRTTDLAYCNNRANWSFDDNVEFSLPAPSCCTSPTVPSLSASSTTVCPGGSSTITITGTLNSATAWQVYTGSCGGTNIGNTATSSFNVTPGSSTTYFIRGEGGCVVPGSCGSVTVNVNPTIGLTANSQTNVACNGGSTGAASVNAATGGAGGFTYNWTPGNPTGDGTTAVTGLTAGTWTCTVTDAVGCTAATNFTVTQPPVIVLNANSQTNVACNGGSTGAASVTAASGGAGGYTYNWTPGNPTGDGTISVTGLTAGTWTCTVTDANSCTAVRNFTITQPPAITLTPASQTNVSCNGGSNGAASINTPTGGAGGFTYNWTPGNPIGDGTTSVTGLNAGTWTCTVTDANGCTATTNFTITQPSALSLTAASQTNVSCNGGANGTASVNIATGGAGGYIYNWTPGNPTGNGTASVTGLTAGTWACTVTDANSCTASVNFTITEPVAIASSVTITDCDSVVVNGTSYYTSGTYTQVLTSINGCDSTLTINATVNNSSTSTTTITTCDSYTWTNGTTYTTSGMYFQTLVNHVGCDSIAALDLTINYSQTSTTTIVACDSYTWTNGATYNVSGTYNQLLTTINGCDSIATLELTINQSSSSTETVVACDSYTWTADGQVYNTSGTYITTLTNATGCDSVITLNLTINTSSITTEAITSCESYTWAETGATYTVSDLYQAVYTGANGCDSIIQLDLTINNGTNTTETIAECESYTWPVNGQTYTTSGTYTVSFIGTNGCDSIRNLDLTITGFPVATATDNGDATITASSGASYQWIDCSNGQAISGATSQTFAPTANGSYAVVVTNASSCSDTSACVTIDNVSLNETSFSNVVIVPNPAKDQFMISMDGLATANVFLYDAQGKLVKTITEITSGQTISLDGVERGIYLVKLQSEKGYYTERLVVQ